MGKNWFMSFLLRSLTSFCSSASESSCTLLPNLLCLVTTSAECASPELLNVARPFSSYVMDT